MTDSKAPGLIYSVRLASAGLGGGGGGGGEGLFFGGGVGVGGIVGLLGRTGLWLNDRVSRRRRKSTDINITAY